VVLAGAILHPKELSDATGQIDVVAGGLNRWYLAHLLYVVGFALFVPAVMALGRRLRGEAPGLELWGTALGVVGLVASTALVALEGFGAWQLAQAGNRAGAVETFDRLVHSAGIVVPFAIVGIALPAGLMVLAVGLGRTRTVPAWTSWVLAAGALLLAVGLVSVIKPVLLGGIAGLSFAMGSIGMSDLGRPVRGTARQLTGRTPSTAATAS
jgi:hypothetical protein